MKIYFHKFSLIPLKPLNRLRSLKSREGVFLKSISSHGVGYSEYFPHPEWGDLSVNDFLETFYLQNNILHKKALHFLDPRFLRQESTPFLNHSFYQGPTKRNHQIIKYKIKETSDLAFLSLFETCKKIRLDANGLFDQVTWKTFFEQIPHELRERIEYIEDPIFEKDWSEVKFSCARDFIAGSPFQYTIYKPYRDFFPAHGISVIFSGNMGHGLGNYQAYLELVEMGDLTLYHGLYTPHQYENLPDLFKLIPSGALQPDISEVEAYLNTFKQMSWESLCTI